MEELTITGRVQRITYKNPENGYTVLKVKPRRGNLFTAVGYIEEVASEATLEGTEFSFTGSWCTSKYGRQFQFTRARLLGSELLFFLSKVVKGLGEQLAKDLIERFGEERLIEILERQPEELLKVKGIKEKRLAMILKSWHKHKSLRELSNYLASSGVRFTPNLLIRIYNYFGDQAVKVIRENPYNLTEVRGIGFKTADKVALGLGIGPHSVERIGAAIEHCLVENAEQNGHCYLELSEVQEEVRQLLTGPKDHGDTTLEDISEERMNKALEDLRLRGKVVLDSGLIGLYSYRFMEDWIRDFFRARGKTSKRPLIPLERLEAFITKYEDREGIEFSNEQKEALRMIACEPRLLFGLAGYAGTGKTTVSKAILELLQGFFAPRDHMIACAFTGMASSRLRKVTGFEAVTIHSLLKFKGDGTFEHHEKNPLPYRVVVLDEASMVNLNLFYRLAKALRDDCLFILVGDPAQLPPIGAGNVFGDALEHGLIPSVTLKRIYRQSEDSVLTVFANEIREGKVPDGVGETGWKDFSFERIEPRNIYAAKAKGATDAEIKRLREENNDAIFKRILALARDYKRTLQHPVWEFQVLTPMRVGQLGTEALNMALQEVLNPRTPGTSSIKVRGIELRKGDKVVHLQNRDMPVTTWDAWQAARGAFESMDFQRIFNGNVGLVLDIRPEEEEFYVVYPERIVVAYDFDHLGDIIELAYALTVHKAQGSQYRIVAIPLTNSHYIMLNNKWFYTAITRAEEKVYIIGQEYALKRACTNKKSIRRKTWLSLNQDNLSSGCS